MEQDFKHKQIEEIALLLQSYSNISQAYYSGEWHSDDVYYGLAKSLYYNDFRIISKDSVVLSKEEINNADYFYVKDGELIPVEKGRGKFITIEWYKELLMKMPLGHELAKERKETAEKILSEIWHNKFETIITIKNSCSKEDVENIGKEILISIRNKLKEIATREGVEIKE